jgi:predicted dehydrogenase
MDQVTALIIGCGSRGEVYSSFGIRHPDRFKIVGLAEPKAHLRRKFAKLYNLSDNQLFSDWHQLLDLPKLADCVIIALPDRLHKIAACALLKKGYHMLLEKPMASSLDDCKEIVKCCNENPKLINAVCHVLRYYDACLKLKQIIDSGLIGDVVNINHTEPIGFWHFAHSFVRGNWRNESQSAFSLLAKCCHDIDLIVFWMGDKKRCVSVQSFGSLTHFHSGKAPVEVGKTCFSCNSEAQCLYSTKKIYFDPRLNANAWPITIVLDTDAIKLADETTRIEDIEEVLVGNDSKKRLELLEKCLSSEKSLYGRCVYQCDNDVCDNQIVNMKFSDNSTASLTMIAFTKDVCTRKTKIYGTKGSLEWDDAINPKDIIHCDFLTHSTHIINYKTDKLVNDSVLNANDITINSESVKLSGHGGSDYFLINSFVNAVRNNDKSMILTDVHESFKSHLIVFAAELSRINNKVVNIDENFNFIL